MQTQRENTLTSEKALEAVLDIISILIIFKIREIDE
jgi:hypothetical protein